MCRSTPLTPQKKICRSRPCAEAGGGHPRDNDRLWPGGDDQILDPVTSPLSLGSTAGLVPMRRIRFVSHTIRCRLRPSMAGERSDPHPEYVRTVSPDYTTTRPRRSTPSYGKLTFLYFSSAPAPRKKCQDIDTCRKTRHTQPATSTNPGPERRRPVSRTHEADPAIELTRESPQRRHPRPLNP